MYSRSESDGKNTEDVEKSPNKAPASPTRENERKRHNFVKDYLVDFTANSSLHGLKYIGEKERTLLEKYSMGVSFTTIYQTT